MELRSIKALTPDGVLRTVTLNQRFDVDELMDGYSYPGRVTAFGTKITGRAIYDADDKQFVFGPSDLSSHELFEQHGLELERQRIAVVAWKNALKLIAEGTQDLIDGLS